MSDLTTVPSGQPSKAGNESQGKVKTGQLVFGKDSDLELDMFICLIFGKMSLNNLKIMTGGKQTLDGCLRDVSQSGLIFHEWVCKADSRYSCTVTFCRKMSRKLLHSV